MRRTLLLSLGLLLLATAPAAEAAEFAPDRVVVGFAPGVDAGERAAIRHEVDATVIGTVAGPRQQVLAIDGDPERIAAGLERRSDVAFAEPDYVVRALWAPNDALLGSQWGLAQTSTPRAWDGARGAGALVGVLDTGVLASHPDLGRLDSRGYDFANRDADPTDDNGHGTGVTGVIAATAGNGAGIAGVAPEATVLEAKALSSTGSGFTSDVAAGANYLADHGARVVNMSLGGSARSVTLGTAITSHPETLFVVAAGNASTDNDAGSHTWPCDETAANVICVGASTPSEAKASFSNWGAVSVDLMAPGQDIATTALNGSYNSVSGTSFSAPMVTGASALLFGSRPDARVADVRSALLTSTDAVPAYAGITVTGGRLNVARALAILSPGALPAVAAQPAPAPAPPASPAPAPTPAPIASEPAPASRTASCRVPQVKRLTALRAKRRLRAAGCRVGRVAARYNTAVRRGRVVTSSPRAGDRSQLAIGVIVSRGRRH